MQLFLKLLLQVLAVGIALLVSLLDYVKHDRRTKQFRRARWWLFACSLIFLLCSCLFIVIDDKESREAHHAFELQLERARQPIRDVYVSYRVDVPVTHPALQPFVARINRAIEESAKAHAPKQGLTASQTRPDGSVISIQVPISSPLFPDRDRDPLPYFLFNYTALELYFYSSGNTQYSDRSKSDLDFGSQTVIDNTIPMFRENGDALAALHFDLDRGVFFIDATNWRVPPQHSRFTGRIQSIPELLDATLVVRYRGYASSNQEVVQKYLAVIQRQITVEWVEINVAGRHLHFSTSELSAHHGVDGTIYYTAVVTSAKDNL